MKKQYPHILLEFSQFLACNKASEATIKAYGYDLILFLEYMKARTLEIKNNHLENIVISDIDISFLSKILFPDILSYVHYITKERNNGASAVARKISSLRTFYHYLVNEKRYLNTNPCKELEIKNTGRKSPQYYQMEELQLFVKSISGHHAYRDKAIILLLLHCAIRLNELIHIRFEDIDFDHGILTIHNQKAEERKVPINTQCEEALLSYIKEERPPCDISYVFLSQRKKPISVRTVQHLIKVHENKLTSIKNGITSQKLRDTGARYMVENENIDIIRFQELLGVKNIASTEKYVQKSVDHIKKTLT
ncbi:MAG: tyrosine-type recombinase/integrase [Eubacteriales bacterium]